MGLPSVKLLRDREAGGSKALPAVGAMSEAKQALSFFDESVQDCTQNYFIEMLDGYDYTEVVMDFIDERYGNLIEYMTNNEKMRTYRHYLRKLLLREQEMLDDFCSVYPHRFISGDTVGFVDVQPWCEENCVKGWEYAVWFCKPTIGFKDATEATGFYLVFGGSDVRKGK